MSKESTVTTLDHVGLVVSDLDQAIATFQALGMGPFKNPNEVHNVVIVETREQGKPINFKSRVALGKMGNIYLQLIQPTEGESVVSRFWKATGGGVHHFAFSVDNIGTAKAMMEKNGFKEIHRAVFQDNDGAAVHFQGEDKHVTIELVEWPKKGVKDADYYG